MNRILLSGVGLLALAIAAQPVAAADLPATAPIVKAPPAAPLFNWTGFYVGGTAGWGWGESNQTVLPAGPSTGDFGVSGGVVGGTLGANWQSGPWVFGLEGDISWSGIDGSTLVNCGVPCATDLRWLATGRARLGHDWNQLLLYVTGGVAVGSVERGFGAASDDRTVTGWTVGAGVERMFSQNWSAKIEYLYVDLGEHNVPISGFGVDVDLRTHIVRAGLNYRFATGKTPVVTRY